MQNQSRAIVVRSLRRGGFVLPLLLLTFGLAHAEGFAQATAPFREDRILVMPKPGVNTAALAALHTTQQTVVLKSFPGLRGLQVVALPKGQSVADGITRYQKSGLVEFVEPDYEIHISATLPDDPKFFDGTLWGLNNVGQSNGIPDADIDAPEAWDVLTSASNIVVAVLDTGVRYTHDDLAANIWVNPLDGSHGWNAITSTNDPWDDQGHGTMVAGVLGAVGNNGIGVVGVAWRLQLMACKCLSSSGTGSDSQLIECIDYARTNGARIINASLDSTGVSLAVANAIVACRDAGIIFVASCGNGPPSIDVDLSPRFPACYPMDNIVSVAYTTRIDALGSFSNFGATNVDLAAPGDQVYSTYFTSDSSYFPLYSFYSIAGTSFAAPCVSGALALMLAKFPAETHQQIIARLLAATDPHPSLAGKCVTGGRLNLHKALSPPIQLTPLAASPFRFRVTAGPNRECVIETSTSPGGWSPVGTNTTSASGTFDFTNALVSPRQFFRAAAAP